MVERCTAGKSFGEEEGGSSGRHRRRGTMPRVRSLVTFGAQHNGISAFRGCKSTDWLCRSAMGLLRLSTWSSFVQNRLVPAQYYRTVNDTTGEPTQEYLDNSNFLADINNERDIKNATYAENLSKVGKLVMYVFQNDTTVVPKESGWFAEVNGTSGEVTPLSERRIYKEDWLGLKLLDERGGLVFRNTSGEHMDLTDEVLEQVFVEFFGPPHEKEEAEDGERQVPSGHDPLEL
jgi:palmitoyl-protein thioesterase